MPFFHHNEPPGSNRSLWFFMIWNYTTLPTLCEAFSLSLYKVLESPLCKTKCVANKNLSVTISDTQIELLQKLPRWREESSSCTTQRAKMHAFDFKGRYQKPNCGVQVAEMCKASLIVRWSLHHFIILLFQIELCDNVITRLSPIHLGKVISFYKTTMHFLV